MGTVDSFASSASAKGIGGDPMENQRERLISLDQFRGYTVVGMLLVNFLGGRAGVPGTFGHSHTYCSYADTIMPQFFFAVGMSYRLTFVRRTERDGWFGALGHAVRRNLGLMLVGFLVYHLDGSYKTWEELRALGFAGFLRTAFQREYFQTLVHIALASLWVLPVIGRSWVWRLGWMVGSGLLFLACGMWFYFPWVIERPGIDGGPLGFLTWTIPLLLGSITMDILTERGWRKAIRWAVPWSIAVMALGYAVSCFGGIVPPPFVAAEGPITFWVMSQRAGSVSYLVFSAGWSLAVLAGFLWFCEGLGWRSGMFRTFGQNALAVYIIHGMVLGAVAGYAPRDAPLAYTLGIFLFYFAVTYLCTRHLERQKLYLKL